MDGATRWPIDYDTLKKGDIIPVHRLEQITGVKQSDAVYALKILTVKDRIESELADRGKLWVIRSEKGSLKILTDEEVPAYTHSEQVRHRAAQRRRFLQQSSADVSLMTDMTRAQHERNLEVDGKYILAQQEVRDKLRLKAEKRKVPGLPQQT
jgi:hypothetical protein